MWAAMRGNLQTMELLLENGADKELTDQEGLNVLDLSVIKIRYESAEYLYKKYGMTRNKDERDLLYAQEPHGH